MVASRIPVLRLVQDSDALLRAASLNTSLGAKGLASAGLVDILLILP